MKESTKKLNKEIAAKLREKEKSRKFIDVIFELIN